MPKHETCSLWVMDWCEIKKPQWSSLRDGQLCGSLVVAWRHQSMRPVGRSHWGYAVFALNKWCLFWSFDAIAMISSEHHQTEAPKQCFTTGRFDSSCGTSHREQVRHWKIRFSLIVVGSPRYPLSQSRYAWVSMSQVPAPAARTSHRLRFEVDRAVLQTLGGRWHLHPGPRRPAEFRARLARDAHRGLQRSPGGADGAPMAEGWVDQWWVNGWWNEARN